MLELELEALLDEVLLLELEFETLLDEALLLVLDDELLATTQLAAIFCVTLIMVLLASFLIRIRVQPVVATSEAGKESSPQPPLRSTLKRGPPLSSP